EKACKLSDETLTKNRGIRDFPHRLYFIRGCSRQQPARYQPGIHFFEDLSDGVRQPWQVALGAQNKTPRLSSRREGKIQHRKSLFSEGTVFGILHDTDDFKLILGSVPVEVEMPAHRIDAAKECGR